MLFSAKGSLFSIAGVGLFLMGGFLGAYFATFGNVQKSSAALKLPSSEPSASIQTQTIVAVPIRLKIPKIGVDAALEHVGVMSDGALGAPKSPVNAGWFKSGPRPGEKGTSVMDGHFGWRDGIAAVFDDLSELKAGDMIYVENEAGETVVFIVRETKTYSQNMAASDVFYSKDGKSHLNLITCEGTWDKADQSYSNRLVVFSDLVASK